MIVSECMSMRIIESWQHLEQANFLMSTFANSNIDMYILYIALYQQQGRIEVIERWINLIMTSLYDRIRTLNTIKTIHITM